MYEELSIYHLPVHFSDQQIVYFDDNDGLDEVVECDAIKKTTFTQWFMAYQTR